MTGKIFIHATNVHQGGGFSLLNALLKAPYDKVEFVLSLDERMLIPEDMARNVYIKRVNSTVSERFKAERWLARRVTPEDVILCFGNLPPLFKLCGYTVVFVQNRYLIDDVNLKGFPLNIRARLAIERLWLSKKLANANEFIVQTPSMKKLLEKKTEGGVPVRVLPFVAGPSRYARRVPQKKMQTETIYDFVYVASGEPHKNHLRLIEAWCLLAEEGLFPSLGLTLDEARFMGLFREIKEMRRLHGLKVKNVGELLHQDVLAFYNKAGALIYPSTYESFGIPLIEARQVNLPVLASELDYVRDVLDPEQSFNPESSASIARAVKRFMGIDEQPLPLVDASQFMISVLKEAE